MNQISSDSARVAHPGKPFSDMACLWLNKIFWVLLITIFSTARADELAPAYPSVPDCSHLLASFISRPFDRWVSRRSERGPVRSRPRFDVRVISDPAAPRSYSAFRMVAAATCRLNDGFEQFSALGFELPKFTHVLIVLDPKILYYKTFEDGWWHESRQSPYAVYQSHRIYGIKRNREVKRLVANDVDDAKTNSFLVLTDFGIQPRPIHSANSSWIIAHELAHFSEGQHTLLWSEARSDTLAYLTTGQPDFSFPFAVKAQSAGPSDARERAFAWRRMNRPLIDRKSVLVPTELAEHDNAQIISAVMYDVAATYGRPAVIDLIHHLDGCHELWDLSLTKNQRAAEVHQTYERQLDIVAIKVRAFARRRGLSDIERILKQREL